ncbi:MAG: hypothetical protein IJ455_06400 [Agathobacter sp.]|nr:hypothetical protein [Agathobacter sp.]
MLKRINPSLPGLIAGIVIYGLIVQLVGVWFVEDKMGYSIGLWYGIAIGIGMAINLATVIYDAVTFDGEGNANKRVAAKSMLRYIVVAILFGILGYFEFGNLFTAFLGVMGLKISAYLQPLLNKLVNKLFGRDDAASNDENSEKEKINKEVTM